MARRAKLQVSLDFKKLEDALRVAATVADYVDIFEVGTPLVKAEGMEVVRQLRKAHPDRLILADMKSPDVGGFEAQIAIENGVDIMTVMGAVSPETARHALAVAGGKMEISVDMTGVSDIRQRAASFKAVGVTHLVRHRPIDEEGDNWRWTQSDIELLRDLAAEGWKVSIAGHVDADTIRMMRGVPVDVFAVGRAITTAPRPAEAAQQLRRLIDERL